MASKLVGATDSNGKKVQVPEHWFDHEDLSKGLKRDKAPSKKATEVHQSNPDGPDVDTSSKSSTTTKTPPAGDK